MKRGISRYRSALRQTRAMLGLAGLLLIAPFWLLAPKRWLAVMGWRLLLGGFDVRVNLVGKPCAASSVLYVANHISWLDIAVLGRVLEAGFVAKSEVNSWPLIGFLARRYGCSFVTRDRRATTAVQAKTVGTRLENGHRLILFPEGTTGLGDRVLPFRSSLFAAASGAEACIVQPVTLAYRGKNGVPLNGNDLRRVAWLGDDELLSHALALAASGGIEVDVYFAEPLPPFPDRKLAAGLKRTTQLRGTGTGQDFLPVEEHSTQAGEPWSCPPTPT